MPAQKLAFSQLLNGNLEWNYTSFLRHIGQKRFRETVFTPTGDYRENLRQTDQPLISSTRYHQAQAYNVDQKVIIITKPSAFSEEKKHLSSGLIH